METPLEISRQTHQNKHVFFSFTPTTINRERDAYGFALVPPGHTTPTPVAHSGHRHVIVNSWSSSSLLYNDRTELRGRSPCASPFLPSVPHAPQGLASEPSRGLRPVPRRNKRPEYGRVSGNSSPTSTSHLIWLIPPLWDDSQRGRPNKHKKGPRKWPFCYT